MDPRQQHATSQPSFVGPPNFVDGSLDVVKRCQGDAGVSLRLRRAEVGQPAIVRFRAGHLELRVVELIRPLVRSAGEPTPGGDAPERRLVTHHVREVREDHLRGDPFRVQVPEPP